MFLFCLVIVLLVKIPTAVELSTWMGVGCCSQPIPIIVWRNSTHLRAMVNKKAYFASAAENITNLIIFVIVSTIPLDTGMWKFSERCV